MKHLIIMMLVVCAGVLASCSQVKREVDPKETNVIKGTETAVVNVSLDEDGMPSINIDTVVVKEGQRVVWVGPKDMVVRFPESSPFKEKQLSTRDAVINEVVPSQSWKGAETTKRFKYDVVVGGKVLDPFLIVRRSF